MTFQEYLQFFEAIISTPSDKQTAPYDNADYIDYTRLNWSRMNRWLKTARLSEELIAQIKQIDAPQHWIVITEPWCGDAAHCVPFIELISRENPLITVTYELRDSAPFRINSYLTNGTKSIPKLVIRDSEGTDIGVWGPRPEGCQQVYARLLAEKATFETIKTEIQNWYNANKGVEIQQELLVLLREAVSSEESIAKQ